MERVREIDNDDMRSFLEEVLRHERSLSGKGEYKQHYLDLIDERVVDDDE
jgi:hypothetical protein